MGEHAVQADIMFVIEGTAINGAYLNDLKTNYLIPTLEFFSQGTIEDRDYVCESTSTLYGLVVYHAADVMPCPSSDCYGPFSSPQRLLTTLDKLELIGGRGESHAHTAEGLATALQAFEDLQLKREGTNIMTQKHCILVCNSPPYQMPVMESVTYQNNTTDQLAAIFNEKNINLSILSPRKIPSMFKLFEKAGGDLAQCQNKNYAKDPRHLVLLRGFSLKERPLSPTPTLPIPSLASPLGNQGSPAQPPGYRPPQPNQIVPPPSPQQGQQGAGRGAFPGPPGYPTGGIRPPQGPRWSAMAPPSMQQPRASGFMGPGQNQGSALIAQLTQPPSSPFPQHRMEGAQMTQLNQIQIQAQQQQQQQQQMRMPGMGMAGQQNMCMGMGPNMSMQQQMNQQGIMQQQQQQQLQQQHGQMGNQVQQGVGVGPGQGMQQQQQNPGQQQPPNTGGQQPQGGRDRPTIWQGVLEWSEKGKSPNDMQKITRQVPCQVSASPKEGESEPKTDSWPQKLIMQLMPKHLFGSIGGSYLKNSTSVLFHLTPCEALESLTRVMSSGFAGCVHFQSPSGTATCDIKVLILLYTNEKRVFLGFIPNDQTAFVDRLRKVIQQQKNSQIVRQNQMPTSTSQPGGTSPMSGDGTMTSQGGVILSQQTNISTMGGGQISQVTSSDSVLEMGGGAQGVQGRGSPMMGMPAQRPPFSQLEAARQQNMAKMQHLQESLQAAQQRDAQYKAQIEILNNNADGNIIQQIQQNLVQCQQQELNFQNQMEQQEKNHLRAQLQQMQQQQQRQMNPQQMGQQGPQQRMVRPQMGPNPGLRHLLQQQQQTPYRQQMINMIRPNQNQNQPFDDVSSFDFIN